MHLCASSGVGAGINNAEGEEDLLCEPAGHGAITTGNITKFQEFWRTFVRSPVALTWIEEGYRLLWTVSPPPRREVANAPSAFEHSEFISGAVEEMLAADIVTLLPPGEKPTVVSPLGVVPKRGTDKFRLTVNMRYVNKHLGKKAFKFEGLKDLADLAERGDYAVSYDLMSGYYHVGLFQASRTYVGFKGETGTTCTIAFPLGSRRPLGSFSKVMRELVMHWRRGGIRALLPGRSQDQCA